MTYDYSTPRICLLLKKKFTTNFVVPISILEEQRKMNSIRTKNEQAISYWMRTTSPSYFVINLYELSTFKSC